MVRNGNIARMRMNLAHGLGALLSLLTALFLLMKINWARKTKKSAKYAVPSYSYEETSDFVLQESRNDLCFSLPAAIYGLRLKYKQDPDICIDGEDFTVEPMDSGFHRKR